MPHWSTSLTPLGLCEEGLDFATHYPDLLTCWQKCERGDWLILLAARAAETEEQRRKIIAVLCEVARHRISIKVAVAYAAPLNILHAWARESGGTSASKAVRRRLLGTSKAALQFFEAGSGDAAAADAIHAIARVAYSLDNGFPDEPKWCSAWAKAAAAPIGLLAIAFEVNFPTESISTFLADCARAVRQKLPASTALASLLHSS